MSEFSINTVHRSPRSQGPSALNASLANSSFTDTFSLSACSSRNEPVPAAQALFISKSTMTPFSMDMYLES
ncbi:hypothetical protein OMAG_002973 [Candidatus Omnitrophus magneticus]|uniref:Uncharacterized protein n=1 Tax=Candidatus Omnitrophus magneticus TaxID=1609969 RepID=A0A0F0CIP4_9BACT|nr:hypothetical protein OMAG_002973 [Candidatus Omnitrophus magneticus]